MSAVHPSRSQPALWDRLRRGIIQRDAGVCWICEHAQADSIDHVIAFTERPDLGFDPRNLRACHHKPCPQCSQDANRPVRCNMIKGALSVERARRIIGEMRAGTYNPGPRRGFAKPSKPVPPFPNRVPPETEGRVW